MMGTVTASSRLDVPLTKDQTPSDTDAMGKTRGKDKAEGQEKILKKGGTAIAPHKLCDSGAAEELKVIKDKKQNWSTVSGTFQTKEKTKAKFKLPKLNRLTKIDYKFHMTPSLGVYDMIIGHDIMKEI
eukprot:15325922-Ditylum_brightwellii.AAC.1